jgi:hypothetical protein
MTTSTDIQNLDSGSDRIRVSPDAVKRASASRESFRNRARSVDNSDRSRSGGVWSTIRKVFGTVLVVGGLGALLMALLWRRAGRNIPIFDPAPGAAQVARQGVPPMGTTAIPEFNPQPNTGLPIIPPANIQPEEIYSPPDPYPS